MNISETYTIFNHSDQVQDWNWPNQN